MTKFSAPPHQLTLNFGTPSLRRFYPGYNSESKV